MRIEQPATQNDRRGIERAAQQTHEVYLFGPVVVKIRQKDAVWRLTPHGQTLGEGLAAAQRHLPGQTAIEIGAGTGVHAIAAMKLGVRVMDVTDIEPAALSSCRENAALNNVGFRHVWQRDWMNFTPHELYDVVLCNPPFCKAPPGNRRVFIQELIRHSPRFLRAGGRLIFVQSGMADFAATERELAQAGFLFARLHEQRHVFRSYYFDEPGFIEECRRVPSGFEIIDGAYVETLRVYLATKC